MVRIQSTLFLRQLCPVACSTLVLVGGHCVLINYFRFIVIYLILFILGKRHMKTNVVKM